MVSGEVCSVCGQEIGLDGNVFKIVMEERYLGEHWEERDLVFICHRCFTDIMLSGFRLRGVTDGKISDEAE